MESKSFAHFFVVCALLAVLVFNSACSSEVVATSVALESLVVGEGVSNPIYTETLALTATVFPTDTPMPVNTSLPTVTFTPTATEDTRVWGLSEVNWFFSHAASWILYDAKYVSSEDQVGQIWEEFIFNETSRIWEGPVDKIEPGEMCEWLYEKFSEGFGTELVDKSGTVVLENTREELWLHLSHELGDATKEPYCAHFDQSLPMPDS